MSQRSQGALWRTQNFLADRRLVAKLVHIAHIRASDVVLDLGAGDGALTDALVGAARVVAIERDPGLAQRLRRRFRQKAGVEVWEGDLLRYPLPHREYVVVSSPPFDITANLVRRLTEAPVPPRDAYLVLQREAAARFAGRPRMTLPALLIAPWFAISFLHRLRRTDFVPMPSVDAVFVRLHKRGPPLVAAKDAKLYRDFATTLVTTWRPSVGASLVAVFGHSAARRLLSSSAIDPRTSASRVTLLAWLRLFGAFRDAPPAIRARVAHAHTRFLRQQRTIAKHHRTRLPRDGLLLVRRPRAFAIVCRSPGHRWTQVDAPDHNVLKFSRKLIRECEASGDVLGLQNR